MTKSPHRLRTRRCFLKESSSAVAASALTGMLVPRVYAAEDHTIRIALIGCGGRGTGAVDNALAARNGPVKLVAMADVFEDRLQKSHGLLKQRLGDQIDLSPDRLFVGLDAYRQAMDCLRPGDVAIFATPPAFRWPHFQYAISKDLNVFMEKPVTVDGPTTRKMLELADQSVNKNLKVGVGLMWRHCRSRRALHERIRDGEIGDLLMLRAYRMHGPLGSSHVRPKSEEMTDLDFQIRRFHGFLWASGGCYSDFYIHNIDECCWMKNEWPVQAQATGGRHYRGEFIDQNFDNYSVEYTFADGAKLFLYGRCIGGCYDQFGSYAHGSKRMAVISVGAGVPAKSAIYEGQRVQNDEVVWKYPPGEPSPYVAEWEDLLEAIRQDQPYNEAKRGAEASLVTSMGRMAAHTGQVITYDQMLNHEHEFAPAVAQLSVDSPAPVQRAANGRFPVPQPGIITKREY